MNALRAIRRIVGAARPPLWWCLAAVVSLGCSSAVSILPPIFTGRIVDALQRTDARAAMQQLALYVGVTLAAAVLSGWNGYATAAFRESIARNLRVLLMGKILRASLSGLERLSFGEVANRLSEDLDGLCYKFEYSLFPSISSLCLLAATVATMFAIDRRFAIVCCAAVAISVLPARLVASRYTTMQRRDAANHDRRASSVAESATLAALAMLRHPRAAARQMERYGALADEARAIRLRGAILNGAGSLSSTLVNLLGPVAVLALGSYLLLHHATTVGVIVTFLMYQGRLYGPFAALSALPLQIAGCGVTAERVLQIYDLEDERSGGEPFETGDVALAGVSVERAGRTLLRGAGLSIRARSHAAFVGPSGAGKSTIGALFFRLHDATSGTVRIGDRDIREFDLQGLREAVCLVPQEPLVFDATLWENLTFLRPSAKIDEVERAIDACRLRAVLDRLPHRYDERLGQRGFRLSGGERQRICVARALIASPQLLVLDEALTGVDVETEAQIFDELRDAYRDRTLVVITHRLAAVSGFERIVVVEGGSVTAQGSHDEVRAASAWYRSACETALLWGEPAAV